MKSSRDTVPNSLPWVLVLKEKERGRIPGGGGRGPNPPVGGKGSPPHPPWVREEGPHTKGGSWGPPPRHFLVGERWGTYPLHPTPSHHPPVSHSLVGAEWLGKVVPHHPRWGVPHTPPPPLSHAFCFHSHVSYFRADLEKEGRLHCTFHKTLF